MAGGIDLPKTVPGISVPKPSGLGISGLGSVGLGAAGSLINSLGSKLISDGYSTGGVGEGIANVGNAVGSVVGMIPGVGTLAGPAIQAVSGVVGGLVNRGFGTKKNDKNISAIQTNTADARNAGNLLASSSTSDALLSNAGSMTTSSDFDTRDLVKGGWFAKGKAKKQGQKFIDAENNALAYQNHGLTTGAEKVDNNLDSTAQSNFVYAFGGPLDYITGGDMGAINYGFMTDYLTAKKKQAEANNKMPGISPTTNVFAEGGIEIKHPGRLTRLKERTGKTEAELWAEGRPEVRKMITFARNSRKWSKALGGKIERDGVTIPDNIFCGGGKMFALGGDIQTNGGDFTNGATHIEAGKTHEENPYEGVQVGVDPQGVPNLVEENEVIFNDYVYSDRIQIDDTTKEKFRISKKREISYANLAKKLEKESLERPNDPISKAALKKQMEELANQQERQKAEMQAEEARKAFEALSSEEQVAIMQQASQQEQIAQEQAMQEQAAEQQAMQEQQVPEEVMAQQPMTPEEAQQQQAMTQQITAEQVTANPEMANVSAYGGPVNKFPGGGALEWLKKNYPNTENLELIANAMDKMARDEKNAHDFAVSSGNRIRKTFAPDYRRYFSTIQKGSGNFLSPNYSMSLKDTKRATKHFNELVNAGIPRDIAFDMAFPQINPDLGNINSSYRDIGLYNKLLAQRNDLYKELVSAENSQPTSDLGIPVQSDAPQAPVLPEGLENASYNTASNTTSYGPQSYNPGLSSDALADLASVPIEDIQNLTPEEVTILNNMSPVQRQAIARQAVELVSGTQPTQATTPNAPVVTQASRQQAQSVASASGRTAQAVPSGGRSYNAGTWKSGTQAENWQKYTRQGLVDYLQNQVDKYNKATTQAEKDAITTETERTVNSIQQAYAKAYQANLTPSEENELVGALQTAFNNAGGNSSFGNIESNINLPYGHATSDNIRDKFTPDNLWGPKTSIRNWGSSEYGDQASYKDIMDLSRQLNLNYALDTNLKYGDNILYTMSRRLPDNIAPPTLSDVAAGLSTATPPLVEGDRLNQAAVNKPDLTEVGTAAEVAKNKGQAGIGFHKIDPRYRPEWLRYAGLLGPAVGLGMQALGLGKPNTKSLDAVLEAYDKNPGGWVDYQTIGDYLRYRPMDVWAQQNRMNANSRATDRTIQNNSGPLGTQIAGLVANNYVNQIGNANLGRQSLEYNDNKLLNVANFNKDTNKTNAAAFNQAEIANAEIKNRKRQLMAQLGMQAAMQKADMNAGWYNSIYGNVAGLFRGIGELGRENGLWNMASESAADDVYGILGDSNTGKRYTRQSSKGGKLKRKKGLTF